MLSPIVEDLQCFLICHTHQISLSSISGLVVEYIVAIDVTRVRFLADACMAQGLAGGEAPAGGGRAAPAAAHAGGPPRDGGVKRAPTLAPWPACAEAPGLCSQPWRHCIGGLVVEYIVAIDVARARFPADASR